MMLRAALALLVLLLMPVAVQAQEDMPQALRDFERPWQAGDWTLQCSAQECQIIGIARPPRDGGGVRALVMLRRGAARADSYEMRLAFLDSLGSQGVPPPQGDWRIHSRWMLLAGTPIALDLAQPDGDGAYRVSPDVAADILSALQRWPASQIRDDTRRIATMPRGNLASLLRRMERLQHPPRPRLTPAETARWQSEYHYTILRSAPADEAVPDSVLLSCDARTWVNRPMGARIGPEHLLWTADCPEGTKIFVEAEGAEPALFNVNDSRGQRRVHSYAGHNANTHLLEIILPNGGNDGCGERMQMGFTGKDFALIEARRYLPCRMVPYEFWPLLWRPTSWTYADPPPLNEGNAPATGEGVGRGEN